MSGIDRARVAGYAFALCAGLFWGTTGPLSTALYAEGAELTDVGFWRVLLSTVGLAAYGLVRRDLFRVDGRGLVLVGLCGGLLVAVFEVAFQFAIAGIGVAGAVALLYTAPILVAFLARPLLGETITLARIATAIVVTVGVTLTVTGHVDPGASAAGGGRAASFAIGVLGGLLAAASYSGSTLLARFAVPRYGAVKVLFLEIAGGTAILAAILPVAGHAPTPSSTAAGWLYIVALGIGAVLAANFFFFAGVRRIDAAPAAVAASVEPVVGALLALTLFDQRLTLPGWLGLAMVVGGVASGYHHEATERPARAAAAVAAES